MYIDRENDFQPSKYGKKGYRGYDKLLNASKCKDNSLKKVRGYMLTDILHPLITVKVLKANQIGGCNVLISTDKARICIDYGANLPGYVEESGDREELNWNETKVDAVFFTHYHGDHIGRFMEIPTEIPLYMGCVAREIIINIYKALHNKDALKVLSDGSRIHSLEPGKPLQEIGDIKVTPYMVDHFAYDAYMLLIETPDKKILHTGDFRTHGHRGKVLKKMIKKYITQNGKRQIDILITEGTMMSRAAESQYSERNLQADAKKLFAEHKHVFLICSSTNLDTLASFYQAARKHRISMFSKDYVYSQLRIFSKYAGVHTKLYDFKYAYKVDFERKLKLKKLNNMTQEEYMRKYGFLTMIKADQEYEEWIEKFADLNPVVVYSMWTGYLNPKHSAYDEQLPENRIQKQYMEKIYGYVL